MNHNDKTAGDPLYMVHMVFDTSRLIQVGRMLNLPLRITSLPYLVHCTVGELFGESAPKPFDIGDQPQSTVERNGQPGREVHLLGYTNLGMDDLHAAATLRASPPIYQSCMWSNCSSKPMPKSIQSGQLLSFETRVCPVVQKASNGEKWNKGQELDVFLSKVWSVADESVKIDRETIYSEWITEQFQRQSAASVQHVGMKRFAIERMSRRTQGEKRTTKVLQRPDVTMNGILKVEDDQAFMNVLRRGIGRHRSFGFGMLKIRPVY